MACFHSLLLLCVVLLHCWCLWPFESQSLVHRITVRPRFSVRDDFPQGTFASVWRHFWLSQLAAPVVHTYSLTPPPKKKIYTGDFQARLFIRNALNSTLGLLDGNLQWRPPSSLVFYKALPCLRRSVSHLLFRSICAHLVSVNWGYLVVERHPTTCDLIVPGDLCPIHVFLFDEKSKKVVFMV